jgi:hypothetical protein
MKDKKMKNSLKSLFLLSSFFNLLAVFLAIGVNFVRSETEVSCMGYMLGGCVEMVGDNPPEDVDGPFSAKYWQVSQRIPKADWKGFLPAGKVLVEILPVDKVHVPL